MHSDRIHVIHFHIHSSMFYIQLLRDFKLVDALFCAYLFENSPELLVESFILVYPSLQLHSKLLPFDMQEAFALHFTSKQESTDLKYSEHVTLSSKPVPI